MRQTRRPYSAIIYNGPGRNRQMERHGAADQGTRRRVKRQVHRRRKLATRRQIRRFRGLRAGRRRPPMLRHLRDRGQCRHPRPKATRRNRRQRTTTQRRRRAAIRAMASRTPAAINPARTPASRPAPHRKTTPTRHPRTTRRQWSSISARQRPWKMRPRLPALPVLLRAIPKRRRLRR